MKKIPEWDELQYVRIRHLVSKNMTKHNFTNNGRRFDRKKTFTHLKQTLLNENYQIRYVGIGKTAAMPFNSFHQALAELNAHISERYQVSYGFETVDYRWGLIPLDTLQLFYHELVIVKTPKFKAERVTIERGLSKRFRSDCVYEDESIVTYMMYFEDGVFADTMEEAVSRIVRQFDPKVERFMNQCQLIDYQMRTVIDSAY